MSVRIPVSADASAAVKAFQEIQRAIERTGQSAKDLARVDLSHPELAKFANDIQQVRRNIDDLMNNARGGTAASARRIGVENLMDREQWQRIHPDGHQGDSRFSNAARYALNGTRWQMARPPGPPQPFQLGPVNIPGMNMPSMSGMAGGMGRAAMSGGAWMLGAAGVGAVAAMASRAVSQAQEEAVANDTLMRSLRDLDTDFAGLRTSVRDATKGLGLTYQEAQRLSLAWVRATNETNGAAATRDVRFAAGVGRSLGLEPSAMVGGLGRAAFMGEDPKRFAVLMAETMRDSGMTGQGEQVMGQLLRWTEGLTRSMGDPEGIRLAAGMYSTLSSSGNPGLRGEFGAALMDRVNASLTQGGAAGDASMHLTYRAMARNGVTDPYQIQHILEGGMFERIGSGQNAPTVFDASMDEINRLYAGLPDAQRWHAGGRHLGISGRQYQAMEGVRTGGGNIGQMGRDLAALGINLSDVNPTAINEISQLSGGFVSAEALAQFGRNRAISQADRTRVAGMSGEDQRLEMVRLLARNGGSPSDGENVRETQAQMTNALTAAGTGLIPVLNDVRDVLSSLGQNIGTLSETLGDVYSGYVRGDPAAMQRLERRRNGDAGGNFPGAPITGEEENQRARFIYEEGMRRGLTHEQASGVVAQGRVESNFRADARGDGGRARGVFQHHPDRQRAMERQFGLPEGGYASASFEDQVRMSYWELMEGPERAAGQELRRSRTAAEAGNTLSRMWERPGDRLGEARRRGALSERFGEHFRNGGSMPDAPRATAPAPAAPGSGPAPEAPRAADAQQQAFNIAPLRVVHENQAGEFLGEDTLPVTRVGGDARPRGLA